MSSKMDALIAEVNKKVKDEVHVYEVALAKVYVDAHAVKLLGKHRDVELV